MAIVVGDSRINRYIKYSCVIYTSQLRQNQQNVRLNGWRSLERFTHLSPHAQNLHLIIRQQRNETTN